MSTITIPLSQFEEQILRAGLEGYLRPQIELEVRDHLKGDHQERLAAFARGQHNEDDPLFEGLDADIPGHQELAEHRADRTLDREAEITAWQFTDLVIERMEPVAKAPPTALVALRCVLCGHARKVTIMHPMPRGWMQCPECDHVHPDVVEA